MKKLKAKHLLKFGSVTLVTVMLVNPVSVFAAENHDHSGGAAPSTGSMSEGSTTGSTSMPSSSPTDGNAMSGGSMMDMMGDLGMDDMMKSMGMDDMLDGMGMTDLMGNTMPDDSQMDSDSSTTGGSMMDDMGDVQAFEIKGMVHGVSNGEQVKMTLMSGMDIIKETNLSNEMDYSFSEIPAGDYMLYVNINDVTAALKHVKITSGNVTVNDIDLHTVSGTITGVEPGTAVKIFVLPYNVQMGIDMVKPLVISASDTTVPFAVKAAVGTYTLKVTAEGYEDNQSAHIILGHQDASIVPIQMKKTDSKEIPPANGDSNSNPAAGESQAFQANGMVHGVASGEHVKLTLMNGANIVQETTLSDNLMDYSFSNVPAGNYMLYVNIHNVTAAIKHISISNSNVTVEDIDLHSITGSITGIVPGTTARIQLIPSDVQMGLDQAKPLVANATDSTIPFTIKAALGSYIVKITAPGYEDFESPPISLGHQDVTLLPIPMTPENGSAGRDPAPGDSMVETVRDSQPEVSFADIRLSEAINNAEDRIVLDAGQENTEVNFSTEQMTQLKGINKPVALSLNGVELLFNPTIFDVIPNSQVTISVQKADGKSGQALPQGSVFQVAESFYEFKIIMDDGKPMELKKFGEPIVVTLPVSDSYWQDAAHQALDVYYLNQTDGKTESMQATHNTANQTLAFKTTHFSNYALVDVMKQTQTYNFTDMQAHWAKKEITLMAAKGYVGGYEDQSFRPDAGINRAEFAAILSRMLKLKESAETGFKDVASDDWYASSIAKVYKAGIVEGDSTSTFRPLEKVTREQMAIMISRALTYANPNRNHAAMASSKVVVFTDYNDVSDWAKESLSMMAHASIIQGMEGPDGIVFNPKKTASRAEAAAMLARLDLILMQP